MFEFKGKTRYAKPMIWVGASVFAAAVAAFVISASFGLAWLAALIFALVGGGSAIVFVCGLNRFLYGRKTVLKIYSDRLEFLNRDRLFAKKYRTVQYADIRKFKVKYHKVHDIQQESGSIWFVCGKKFCWVELENVSDGAWAVLARLRAEQLDGSSEL